MSQKVNMITSALIGFLVLVTTPCFSAGGGDTALIRKTADFAITGRGDNPAWEKTGWQSFTKIDSGGKYYTSKSKVLYSEKGIYVLFTGEDERITTKDYKDDEEIYEGDVFELFIRTDPTKPPYFEYEINQLDKQLILMLARFPHQNMAWSPWGYEYRKNPLLQKKVAVNGPSAPDGPATSSATSSATSPAPGRSAAKPGSAKPLVPKPGAAIRSWSAELFFPYELLGLLPGVPPKSGDTWRANFCRIDYDSGKMVQWSWSKKIKRDFHELENFGTVIFE